MTPADENPLYAQVIPLRRRDRGDQPQPRPPPAPAPEQAVGPDTDMFDDQPGLRARTPVVEGGPLSLRSRNRPASLPHSTTANHAAARSRRTWIPEHLTRGGRLRLALHSAGITAVTVIVIIIAASTTRQPSVRGVVLPPKVASTAQMSLASPVRADTQASAATTSLVAREHSVAAAAAKAHRIAQDHARAKAKRKAAAKRRAAAQQRTATAKAHAEAASAPSGTSSQAIYTPASSPEGPGPAAPVATPVVTAAPSSSSSSSSSSAGHSRGGGEPAGCVPGGLGC
jgi:hypothetical protein